MNYKISSKRNEKWHTWGNIKQGDKGLRGGIKKTPELMQMLNDLPDGSFFNFLLFEEKDKPEYKPAVNHQGETLDNQVPF